MSLACADHGTIVVSRNLPISSSQHIVFPSCRCPSRSQSLALLNTSPGNVVLDAACGRGHTTACLAEKACHALGADIQPQQIERARERFGHRPHVSFAVADLTRLPEKAAGVDLTPGCIDPVHCLEAAFHFGPAGRRAFLAGNHRVLRPGGRLVLVDFAWPDTALWTLAELDSHRLVRVRRGSSRTSRPRRPTLLMPLLPGSTSVPSGAGRRTLSLRWPGLAELAHEDWQDLITVIRAHQTLGRVAGYHALVCDKPAQ
ncbi:class I SAM-dependent methyltransferase [Streptomyces sp. G5(2025)]|uniref:class I SAM-dependent methyltransferase n=1 Tax=Streptomyces sp. G5(2025) TaxID=3406628 RepID=UPI003C1CC867